MELKRKKTNQTNLTYNPAELSRPTSVSAHAAHPAASLPLLSLPLADRWGPPVGFSFDLQPAPPLVPRAGRRPSRTPAPPPRLPAPVHLLHSVFNAPPTHLPPPLPLPLTATAPARHQWRPPPTSPPHRLGRPFPSPVYTL
jgi:hypothetical protein